MFKPATARFHCALPSRQRQRDHAAGTPAGALASEFSELGGEVAHSSPRPVQSRLGIGPFAIQPHVLRLYRGRNQGYTIHLDARYFKLLVGRKASKVFFE